MGRTRIDDVDGLREVFAAWQHRVDQHEADMRAAERKMHMAAKAKWTAVFSHLKRMMHVPKDARYEDYEILWGVDVPAATDGPAIYECEEVEWRERPSPGEPDVWSDLPTLDEVVFRSDGGGREL